MKTMWMKAPAVAALALLAGCGHGGNAALSRTFNYGAPQVPSTSEQAAASTAQTGFSNTASFSSSPDSTKGAAVVALADVLAASALGSSGALVRISSGPGISSALSSAAVGACATVSGNTVTFSNCSYSASGVNFTFNGSIAASAGSVTWNISGGFSGTSNGYNFDLTMHQSGTISVTGSKITGDAVSDLGGTISAQGQSIGFGVASAAVVDLTYQSTPSYCITAGSLEVKRVWTQRPSGQSSSTLPDAGVKILWTGCNTFQVAHSQ